MNSEIIKIYRQVQDLRNRISQSGIYLNIRAIDVELEKIVDELFSLCTPGEAAGSAMEQVRKVIQIATHGASCDTYAYTIALCDDGTMWQDINVQRKWEQVPNVPQCDTNAK